VCNVVSSAHFLVDKLFLIEGRLLLILVKVVVTSSPFGSKLTSFTTSKLVSMDFCLFCAQLYESGAEFERPDRPMCFFAVAKLGFLISGEPKVVSRRYRKGFCKIRFCNFVFFVETFFLPEMSVFLACA